MEKKTVGVISLGCDKNRVDTEKMLALLSLRHDITDKPEEAQIIIVNTCAFLQSSRKESVGEIINASRLKEKGKLEKLIVTGCLPQKYKDELFGELVEADAVLGTEDYGDILDIIDGLYEKGGRINGVKNGCAYLRDRKLTTDNYAYLKIAEGCDNHCTYCLIPSIRGKYRSFPKEKLVEEARSLGSLNELILVAQDTAAYGKDLTPASSLSDLIRSLSALDNIKGIRVLYCYPENLTDELIREFATNSKLIRYIDIPFQHADDGVLKLMNRKGNFDFYLSLVERLKREVAGIAIRSTFITGFPQESEEAFERLTEFLSRAKLFNAGFFKFSREEGTPAYNLSGQIKEGEKTKRLKKLYSLQKKICKEKGKELIGKIFFVAAEGFDEDRICYYGRAYFNAPEIDGKVYFFSSEEVKKGEFYRVRIIKYSDYDFYGERI